MMENISPNHHNEGSLLPQYVPSVKHESTDSWTPQLITSSGMLTDCNFTTTYAPLQNVAPALQSSYASPVQVHQYYTQSPSGTFFNNYCMDEGSDMYLGQQQQQGTCEDPRFSVRDEGLGSSPSSFNSSSPPLHLPATTQEQPISAMPLNSMMHNFIFQRISERSSPEDFACEEMNRQCGKCGIRNNVTWYIDHYLCGTCLLEKTRQPPVVQEEDAQNDRKRKRSATVNKKDNQACTNCETTQTTLWRRSSEGLTVCNACGLYEKLHKVPRPKTMRKDSIQTRKRKPKPSQTRQRKKNPGSKAQPAYQRAAQPCSSSHPEQYPLPTYNSLQVRNLPLHMNNSAQVQNTAPLPPMDSNSFFQNYHRSDIYNIYPAVSPNEVISDPRVQQSTSAVCS